MARLGDGRAVFQHVYVGNVAHMHLCALARLLAESGGAGAASGNGASEGGTGVRRRKGRRGRSPAPARKGAAAAANGNGSSGGEDNDDGGGGGGVSGKVFMCTDATPVDNFFDFFDPYLRRKGYKVPTWRLPYALVYPLAWLCEGGAALARALGGWRGTPLIFVTGHTPSHPQCSTFSDFRSYDIV